MLCIVDLRLNGGRDVLRLARQTEQVASELRQAGEHNRRLKLKLDMLLSPLWRARVLKDLGGEAMLTRWEAQVRGKIRDPLKPHASMAQRLARSANLEKARDTLRRRNERQATAKERRKRFDDTHPNILFDRVKVDSEGQFRLAPIPRAKVKVVKTIIRRAETPDETEARLERNAYIRSVRYVEAAPIPVWPFEFRAAAETFGAEEVAYETKSATPTGHQDSERQSSPGGQPCAIAGEDNGYGCGKLKDHTRVEGVP